jgi:cell division protein FtsL
MIQKELLALCSKVSAQAQRLKQLQEQVKANGNR